MNDFTLEGRFQALDMFYTVNAPCWCGFLLGIRHTFGQNASDLRAVRVAASQFHDLGSGMNVDDFVKCVTFY